MNKKELILNTAKELFSSKGYDASSMDEIANNINIPKSLIYYHFKSKEELLNAVIDKFFKEYEKVLQDESVDDLKKYLNFLENNNSFLRIIIIESLKKDKKILLFKVVELLLKYDNQINNNDNLNNFNHSRFVAEFFTSIIPCVMFECHKNEWCVYFNVEKKLLEQDFISAYNLSHGEYHKNLREN